MLKIIISTFSSVIFLSSCAGSFKTLEYGSIHSLDELDGIYVDTVGYFGLDKRVSYSPKKIMELDTADIYEFQFINNKYLKLSTLTEKGFQEIKTYTGKHDKGKNYLEVSIKKKILPLIILNSYFNERKRIGKDKNDNLRIDYRLESFGMLIPFGATSYDYQTSSTLVKLENVEYIPSKLGSKFGYTNYLGDLLIEPKYDFARVFRNDVARVIVNDKWGLINKRGSYIFEPQFDYISDIYKDSTAYVIYNNYLGLIDKIGNEILPVKELEINWFYELKSGVFIIEKNKKKGVYSSITKKYIAEPIYDDIQVKYSKQHKEWEDHYVEPYLILSLAKEKAILVNDTLVIPLTPQMQILDIFSLYPQTNDMMRFEKVSDKIYAPRIDFSDSPIKFEDVYPFYLKINDKLYLIDHKNNFHELFFEKLSLIQSFTRKSPRVYIGNDALIYEQIINRSK